MNKALCFCADPPVIIVLPTVHLRPIEANNLSELRLGLQTERKKCHYCRFERYFEMAFITHEQVFCTDLH